MDLNAVKLMLKEDEDIKEIINLKSNQISETEESGSNRDLDESWEKAEEWVINVFLDKLAKTEAYAWEALYSNQAEFKDANIFICILGFILSKGDVDCLPPNTRNQANYTIGLSYISGIFCVCNQLITVQRMKRKEAFAVFNQNDLVCKALKHYVHNDPNSPYFDYYKPFATTESQTDQGLRKALKEEQFLVDFLTYCGHEQEKIGSQIQKMLKL